jgi:HlyD family type I secretion membrane fusion protein
MTRAPKGQPPPPDDRVWTGKTYVILAFLGLVVLIGGFGSWAAIANISGAIISSGRVAVDRNRQVIQHPHGGVVEAILVREGARVVTGDPLLRLDPSELSSERQILGDQLNEALVRTARLEAERDNTDTIAFPEHLADVARTVPDVADMITGQRNLFGASREALNREVEQLVRRKGQIGNQIDGIGAQQKALSLQLGFLDEELKAQQSLLSRGLAQAPRVLALQRENARLLGQVGEFGATVAELEGEATQMDLEVLKLRGRAREKAISELRDLQFQRVGLSEQVRALDERLSRLVIRAPIGGVVHDMQVFAERAVIRSGDPILYIVPQDRPLVIQTRVEPIHIDQVSPGQPVTLRLPAFDARTTPELFGSILRISPDALTDQATGATYYEVEILPDEGEIAKLGDQVLLPGMPVEAYLRTDDRTPLSYLIKPLADYFNRAFREG